jgi:hypothetical protein
VSLKFGWQNVLKLSLRHGPTCWQLTTSLNERARGYVVSSVTKGYKTSGFILEIEKANGWPRASTSLRSSINPSKLMV